MKKSLKNAKKFQTTTTGKIERFFIDFETNSSTVVVI